MSSESYAVYTLKCGPVRIEEREGAVTLIKLLAAETEERGTPTALTSRAFEELQEYLSGKRTVFSFPYALRGTDFQKKVWEQLEGIPYGKTRTYGEIAAAMGQPGASRAVGMACNKNPLWAAVPCHRVVGAKGKLTGYAQGLALKAELLELEKKNRFSYIEQELILLAEPDYRRFASSLLPGCTNLLGVRLPALRKIAVRLAGEEPMAYLQYGPESSFEAVMLKGLLIGHLNADIDAVLAAAAAFIPKITNWSLCDSFCGGLKLVKSHKERVWAFLTPYWHAKEPYAVRTATVLSLLYFIEEKYLEELFYLYGSIQSEDYYVKMAVAWAVSMCFVKFPAETEAYLRSDLLDRETHNKALQKIRESLQVGDEAKQRMAALKR